MLQWLDGGLVKKVRGLCFTRRVAPVVANRIIESAKKHLNKYLPDVYFICDNAKGPAPGEPTKWGAQLRTGVLRGKVIPGYNE